MVSIVIFLLILGLLVLIHEFGHFIAAKKSGVMVEEFGFGFPPRLWGKKIGETIYSINAIPLGGFVKLFGEEYAELTTTPSNKSLKEKAFVFKKPHLKAVIILAGVFMNAVLGITIYYGLLSMNGFQSDPMPLIKPYKFKFGVQEGRVVATNIAKDSPASKAGITVEDIIERYQVASTPVAKNWKQITSATEIISTIKSSEGKTVYLDVENVRNGKRQTIAVVPYYNKELKRAIIGVNLLDTVILKYVTPKQKIFSGFMHSYNVLAYNYSTIGELFKIAVKEKTFAPVSQTVSGPIGIYSVVNDVIQTSGTKLLKNMLNIIGLLSLSLAAMNILPLPALDGGRLVFVLYEWITGKQVNKKFEQYVNLFGFIALISLGVLVSINDVLRLLKI